MSKNNIRVTPLYEGTFSVGTDYVFNRIAKDGQPAKNSLKLSIHPFLIQDGERNILFDAGLGDLYGAGTTIETMQNNLEEQSVSDYEITDVFISHLHFDHFAGLAHRENGYWELTFPDAAVWVSEQGWKKLHQTIEKQAEEKQDLFHFLDMKANLAFTGDSSKTIPHVRTKTIGGHTEHHQVLFYENGDDNYLMAGDVIGRRISINQNFAAKYDFAPQQSMKARDELKKQARNEKYVIMAYHETDHPLFMLTDFEEKKGYTIKNL